MITRILGAWKALLATASLLGLLLGMPNGSPVANAQDEPVAALTLERQTPFVLVNDDPALKVRVRAENLGDAPLDDLSLGVTLGLAVTTRTAYDASLLAGPAFSLKSQTLALDGSLQPGASRVFDLGLDLVNFLVPTTESRIYPLRIDLRVGDLPTGAELRTPVLVLARQPEQPLEVTWVMELDPPPAIGTDGRLVDPSLLEAIAPGGDLRGEVDALGAAGTQPFGANLVVSPRFLDELGQMADGFLLADGSTVAAGEGAAADAADMLDTLRAVAASDLVEISALPYAAPNLPALLRSNLARDVDQQVDLGIGVVTDVLGVAPSTTVARAPGGTLDQATIEQLSVQGAGIVLADSDTIVRPPDPEGLTIAPTGLIAGDFRDLPATLPDPGVQALLAAASTSPDPTLAAQAVLGELAAVWQEAPRTGFPRGVVISTAGLALPARFWETFGRRVVEAPFLHPVSASRLVEEIPPVDPPQSITAPSAAVISKAYAEAIKRERRRVDALESMLEDPGSMPDRLRTSLLVAESGAFVGNESSGRRWIDGVTVVTGSVFEAATPRTSQQFTLDSTSGTIPIRLGDPGGRILNVVIELSSAHLQFPQGNERSVRITEPDQIVFFPVEAAGTGQITVVAVVKAPLPSGRTVAATTLIVRSTAYSRIALIVTGAAALVLVLLWARRFVRRATS